MAVSVVAKLGFDGKAFEAGVKKARTSLNSLTKGALKSQVTQSLSWSFLSSQIKQAGDFASQLSSLAPALGMTTDELQQWEYVFARAGLEIDDVADAFATLADRTEDALDGTVSMIDDFKLIGITLDQLRGKNPQQLFELFADGVRNTTDQNRALAAIVRNLGDDLGRKLAPMLMLGSDGLRAMREEAEKLGIVMDAGNIQEVAAAMTQMKIASMQMRSAWGSIAAFIGSSLTTMKDGFGLINIIDHHMAGKGYEAGVMDANPNLNPLADSSRSGWIRWKAYFTGIRKNWDKKILAIGQREMAEDELRKDDPLKKGDRHTGGVNEALKLAQAKAALQKKIADAKFKELSAEEKINELMRQRAVITDDLRFAEGGDRVALLTSELDLNERIKALKAAGLATASAGGGVRGQALTASQSVGAFVQRNNPLLGIARKQLLTQEQIRDALNNPRSNPTNNPHGTGGMES